MCRHIGLLACLSVQSHKAMTLRGKRQKKTQASGGDYGARRKLENENKRTYFIERTVKYFM